MMNVLRVRIGLALALVVALVSGILLVTRESEATARTHVVAYFSNSNGIFVGDQVRILGVPVGKIDSIEAQPQRVKISFWFDSKYKVPATAGAAILSPSLVTARAIQLTPAYTAGPVMAHDAVIPQERTVVPVEWDDLREQLQKITETLQPTQAGGVSTLGAYVNTLADNLRGQGPDIRDTVIKLSKSLSTLGDHSGDIFGTIKSLATLVSALRDSSDGMRQLNENLAVVTQLMADDPNEVGNAVADLNAAVTDVNSFIADHKDTVVTTSEKLTAVSNALTESLDDVKQTLHVTPTAFANFLNIYQPAQGSLTGALVANNFANPITFLCGAIQAASRMSAEQSAKLCVQYLSPIIKNRQINFPPLGENLFVGASARPNEITYSEDWMRPDHVPPALPAEAVPPEAGTGPGLDAPTATTPEVTSTNPDLGLSGMMTPPEGSR